MSASLDRYRVIVPAHSAVADAVVEAELAMAAAQHNVSIWGDLYVDAMCWLAAHHVQLFHVASAASAGLGAVTQQRDGDLSRSYASSAQGDEDDWLRTTGYGQRYLRCRRSTAAGTPRWVGVA